MSTKQAAVGWPVTKLTPPGEENDPVSNIAELILNGNGVSLTYYANTIIAGVTGFDPIGTVTNYVTGDWNALYQSAEAIRNLAGYNDGYQQSIATAVGNFAASWTGNAGDSARAFFTTLGDRLTEQIDPLNQMADKIEEFARNSYNMANGLAAVIQYLGDTAIQWAITSAAAKAAAASGVGVKAAVALEAIAALLVVRMLAETAKLISAFGNWVSAGEFLHGYLNSQYPDAVKIPELPEQPYNHPGVS